MKRPGKKTLKQKMAESAAAGGSGEQKTPKSEYRPKPRPAPKEQPRVTSHPQAKELGPGPLKHNPFFEVLKNMGSGGTV